MQTCAHVRHCTPEEAASLGIDRSSCVGGPDPCRSPAGAAVGKCAKVGSLHVLGFVSPTRGILYVQVNRLWQILVCRY